MKCGGFPRCCAPVLHAVSGRKGRDNHADDVEAPLTSMLQVVSIVLCVLAIVPIVTHSFLVAVYHTCRISDVANNETFVIRRHNHI